MKITRIQVDNFLGIRSVDAVLNTPVTLFCGANAAGKSSIQEAVRMAVTGDTVRVKLVKEYPQLVADGAKAGGALISIGEKTYAFDVPSGKSKNDEELPSGDALDISLNGQRFASMPSDDKRTFLFNLTGCKASGAEVNKRLTARECDAEKIAAILPLLRTGFPSACKQAETNATESKRDWKTETGAVYGSKVAEGWKATKPAEPPPCGSADDLVALGEEIAALNQEIGALNAAGRAAEEARSKREALKTKAESVDQVAENLSFKRTELELFLPQVEDIRQRASGTKRVGLIHDLAYAVKGMLNIAQDINDFTYVQASATLDRYEEQHGELQDTDAVDQDAKASLPEYERGLEVLQNVVKNLERDLEAAKAAKAAYDALAPADAITGGAGDLDALQTRLVSAKANYDKTQAEIRAVEQYDAAVKAAAAKTEKAAAHHADVVAWLQIAAALAPDGIPGELLEEALQPINATLKLAATDTKWPCVAISKDMEVTAKGRAYGLLSESEKWRVDAMIAQAIAKISGYKILMLDRMDVLDLKGRGELLGWLDMLADDGHIETALLFATLKAMPSGLPPTMQAFWLADGSIQEFKAAA